jgi:hypothetical protein
LMASPGLAVAADPKMSLANFPTAQEAQQHCPDDLVVWLDPPARTYHYRGQRWYGLDEERRLCLPQRGSSGGDAGHAKCRLREPPPATEAGTRPEPRPSEAQAAAPNDAAGRKPRRVSGLTGHLRARVSPVD